MVYRLLFLFTVLNSMACHYSFGQEIEVSIADTAKTYSIDDSLNILITNRSKEDFFVSIGLEMCNENKWDIVKDDIFQCWSCRHTRLLYLNEYESHTIRWSISFLLTDSLNSFKLSKRKLRGSYRFRIDYSNEETPKQKRNAESREFRIR